MRVKYVKVNDFTVRVGPADCLDKKPIAAGTTKAAQDAFPGCTVSVWDGEVWDELDHSTERDLDEGAYLKVVQFSGAANEPPTPEYLQAKYGVSTIDAYLQKVYKPIYDQARPAKPGYRGRLPSNLRSLGQPFKRTVTDIDGKEHPVSLGRQLPLMCRQDMIRAALFFFAKIENRFLYGGGGDSGYLRSLCLMAFVGSPGTGKTTALLELVHLLREHIDEQRGDALDLLSKSVPQRQDAQTAEDSLQRLSRSVREGKELVSWLRLESDNELVAGIEDKVPINTVLALRLMYGFLSYLDNLDGPPSPTGSYEAFLFGLDERVRGHLMPAHAFDFLDSVTYMDPKAQRVVFVNLDEFNAVQTSFPTTQTNGDRPKRTFAQELVSKLIRFTDQQNGKERLVLPFLATSRHTDATLASTSTPKAQVAPLPLNAPLITDIQKLLWGIGHRVQLNTGSTRAPTEAADDEHSPAMQLVLGRE